MLNARAIARLLLDDEVPPLEPPGGSHSVDLDDPQATLDRYLSTPITLRGTPVSLYQDWIKLLGGRSRRNVVGGATVLINRGEAICLQYHNTFIVSVTPENRVTVNTNGYYSRTTMSRINWASPGGWSLFGRKPRKNLSCEWNFFWCNYSTRIGSWEDKRLFPYAEGDVIEPDGTLTPQLTPDYKKVYK